MTAKGIAAIFRAYETLKQNHERSVYCEKKSVSGLGRKMKVAARAATYQRPPKRLKRLTDDLNRLTLDARQILGSIVIVDDDAAGLVNAFCEEMHSYVKWPRMWPVESLCGIPCAHKRAGAYLQEGICRFHRFKIGDNEVLVS